MTSRALVILAALLACKPIPTEAPDEGKAKRGAKAPAPAPALRVTVRDAQGRPVPQVLVAVLARASNKIVAGQSTTDAGVADFAELPPGTYVTTATGPAGSGEGPEVAITGAPASSELRLEPGVMLTGEVRDNFDRALADTAVRFDRLAPTFTVYFGSTDAAGRFAASLPAGWYTAITGDGASFVREQIALDSPARVTLRINRPYDPEAHDLAAVAEQMKAAAIPIRTADPAGATDDLEPLGAAVGDARLVGLGEATHGTREFFQLKHRVFRHLVEARGFTAIALEAPFAEALAVDTYVRTGKGDPVAAVRSLRQWPWLTEEMLALVQWVRRYNADPKHRRKLRFYGLDIQFAAAPAAAVMRYLEQVDPEYARTDGAVLRDARLDRSHPAVAERLALRPLLQAVADRLVASEKDYVARAGEEAHRWARQHMHVALTALECESLGAAFSGACRDRAMAGVATWLLDQEGEAGKLALWAHDGHVARTNFAGTTRTMGQELAGRLGAGYVATGFAFDRGGFQAVDMQDGGVPGGLREFRVEASPADHLDAVLARTDLPIAAFDLRRIDGPAAKWLSESVPKREVDAFVRAPGPGFVALPVARAFDLLIFVAETSRARPLPAAAKKK